MESIERPKSLLDSLSEKLEERTLKRKSSDTSFHSATSNNLKFLKNSWKTSRNFAEYFQKYAEFLDEFEAEPLKLEKTESAFAFRKTAEGLNGLKLVPTKVESDATKKWKSVDFMGQSGPEINGSFPKDTRGFSIRGQFGDRFDVRVFF